MTELVFVLFAAVVARGIYLLLRAPVREEGAPRPRLQQNAATQQWRVVQDDRFVRGKSGTLSYVEGTTRYFDTHADALDYMDKLEADNIVENSWRTIE